MLTDLVSMRSQLAAGQSSAAAELERCIAAAASPACAHVFRQTCLDEARAAAAAPGVQLLPLAGLAVSVKDLFDIKGLPTAAGSSVLAGAAPASTLEPA
ncbi:MAG TPA: amidase family protein, partial [Alicycliphilus sp.]|nr:amidase family protein [Alicycliphilus sp.]